MRSAFWLYFLFVFLILQGFSESLASFENKAPLDSRYINVSPGEIVQRTIPPEIKEESEDPSSTSDFENEIKQVGGAEGYDSEIDVKTPESEKVSLTEVTNLKIKTDGLTEESIFDFLKYPLEEKNKTSGAAIPFSLSTKLYQSKAVEGYYPVKNNCIRVKKISDDIGSFSEKVFMISVNMGPGCLEIRKDEAWKNSLIIKELRMADPDNSNDLFTYPAEREIKNLQNIMSAENDSTPTFRQGMLNSEQNFPILSYPEGFFSFEKITPPNKEEYINLKDFVKDDNSGNYVDENDIPVNEKNGLFSNSYQNSSAEKEDNYINSQKSSISSVAKDSKNNILDNGSEYNTQIKKPTRHYFIIMHAAQGDRLSNYTREIVKSNNIRRVQDLSNIYKEFGKTLANFHRSFMDLKTIPMTSLNIKDFTTILVNNDDSFDKYFHTIVHGDLHWGNVMVNDLRQKIWTQDPLNQKFQKSPFDFRFYFIDLESMANSIKEKNAIIIDLSRFFLFVLGEEKIKGVPNDALNIYASVLKSFFEGYVASYPEQIQDKLRTYIKLGLLRNRNMYNPFDFKKKVKSSDGGAYRDIVMRSFNVMNKN